MSEEKTNVMRILDQKKIQYVAHYYDTKGSIDGVSVANMLGQETARVFKTLVTISSSMKNYVFVIPVDKELNLKVAAKAVNEKSIAMLKQVNLLPLTGYIHGGCSPIGMKKFFTTVIDSSAQDKTTIYISAGKIGAQVEISPKDLSNLVRAKFANVTYD